MSRRSESLFASRGIPWRTIAVTALVVVLAFAAGIAAGWGTGQVPDLYRAATAPSASPTPTPTPTPTVEVSIPPLAPISRELTDDDIAAGITSIGYTVKGDGSFTSAPGVGTAEEDGAPVRLVRIDVEDGLGIDAELFGSYVMNILNDPRGWGSEGRMQFVQTQDVPDVRIVIASPYTAAELCPDPHATGQGSSATVEAPADTGDSASEAPQAVETCADRGTGVISEYDWVAGLLGYGEDFVGARDYLVTHATGHVLAEAEAEAECVRGVAPVMADQREPMPDCTVNPWAYPDAPIPDATQSPSPNPES
ncbi:DUF3152 domain-containing protein [Demequina aurantiaca]|uniref:DUF3152 domain-containing protein n=1 Tax=Demequina aurantiaca TaxID=676200 RepID=UPI003D345D54